MTSIILQIKCDAFSAKRYEAKTNLMVHGSKKWFPELLDLFTETAGVDSDDLEEVFEIGNGYGDLTKLITYSKMSSVSVGDIIKQGDELYMVEAFGFKKLEKV